MDIPSIDQAFRDLTSHLDLEVTGLKELESVETTVTRLLDSLTEHLVTFDDIDTKDIETMVTTINVLTELISAEFERCAGLSIGDSIVAYGDTIALMIDDDMGCDFSALGDDVRLRGIVSEIGVLEIPRTEELVRICRPEFDSSGNDPIRLNPFGLVIRIDNPTISTRDNDEEAIPDELIVMLPLNYPQLKLFRHVNKTT